MENSTIQTLVIYFITYLGIPFVAVKAFDWMQRPDTPTQVQNLSYGTKRIAALVVAGIILAVVWFFGFIVRAYPQPTGDWVDWVNAYLAKVWPVAVIDQVIHGYFSMAAKKAKASRVETQ